MGDGDASRRGEIGEHRRTDGFAPENSHTYGGVTQLVENDTVGDPFGIVVYAFI